MGDRGRGGGSYGRGGGSRGGGPDRRGPIGQVHSLKVTFCLRSKLIVCAPLFAPFLQLFGLGMYVFTAEGGH